MSDREYHKEPSPLECREETGSPGRLVGVILPAGRVAGDRKEIIVGSGIQTPSAGMVLLPEHRSTTTIMTFDPVRDPDGTLRIDHRLPNSVEGRAAAESVLTGRTPALSAEFHALDAGWVSGVREARQSLVSAAALVPAGAYNQATAEVRAKGNHRRVLTWL